MTTVNLLRLLLLTMCLCGPGCDRATSAGGNREVLISESRLLWEQSAYGKAENQGRVSSDIWPSSIRKMRPLYVRRFMGGIFVVVEQTSSEQRGLFIPIQNMNAADIEGSGVSVLKSEDGVYWIAEKIRIRVDGRKVGRGMEEGSGVDD